jgi:hypothetical protein
VSLPVELHFKGKTFETKKVEMRFPIRPDQTSDPDLLMWLFEANSVLPPEPTRLPPIYYNVHPERKDSPYHTVSALLSLDEGGDLLEVTFPIKGQDIMTHPVLITLIGGEFEPAFINGEPIASKFILTFRIFDNLKYPISSLYETDSINAENATRKHFLTQYYSTKDISIYPLPRKYPFGSIHSAKLGQGSGGFADLKINIDPEGMVSGVFVLRASSGLRDKARDIIRLTRWYPAINYLGENQGFSGKVRLQFDGSTRVVYIPEWLKP